MALFSASSAASSYAQGRGGDHHVYGTQKRLVLHRRRKGREIRRRKVDLQQCWRWLNLVRESIEGVPANLKPQASTSNNEGRIGTRSAMNVKPEHRGLEGHRSVKNTT